MTPQPAPHLPPPVYRDTASTVRLLAVLLLVVAGALIWTLLRQQALPGGGPVAELAPAPSETQPPSEPRAITARGDLASDEEGNIELFRSVAPSVVHIINLQEQRDRLSLNVCEIPQGSGSGFLWDEQGHVVTNYHVIQGADRVAVTLYDNTTIVRWGQRGRVGSANIKPRAQFAVTQLAPWVDASAVTALPAPLAMRPGESWTANLVLPAPPAALARAQALVRPRLSNEQDQALLRRALARQVIGIGGPSEAHWTPNERWLKRQQR